MSQEPTTLFRWVGQAGFDLIRAAVFRACPPWLLAQPFFYPVANQDYPVQIARGWNTNDAASGFARLRASLPVRTEFLSRVRDSYRR